MGMYNYISDIETKFIEVQVPEIIKNSDTLEEAIKKSETLCEQTDFTPHRSVYGLDEVVTEMWNEYWSKYNMGGC